jgi:hypothetical protein
MHTFYNHSKVIVLDIQLFLVIVNYQPSKSFNLIGNHYYYTNLSSNIINKSSTIFIIEIYSIKETQILEPGYFF